MTLLIADSGSTKTDWALCQDGRIVGECQTQGINPVHQSPDTIRQILTHELQPRLSASFAGLCFYGSGCTPAHIPAVEQLMGQVFPGVRVQVFGDMLGAARAVCGHEPGQAAILGTGANSCLYDGERMVQNTPALGYVLGDEGSGAVLGRLFFNALYKDAAFADLRRQYEAETGLAQSDVINRVYRQPLANRFLASTSLFIRAHVAHPLLHQLVVGNFRQLFRRNLLPYGRPDLPVGFVGSMAAVYSAQLAEAAEAEGFTVGRVMQSPMAGLVAYHGQEAKKQESISIC